MVLDLKRRDARGGAPMAATKRRGPHCFRITYQTDYFTIRSILLYNIYHRAQSVEVILGAHNIQEEESTQQVIRSRAIIVHEDWDSSKVLNDIAIIFLSRKIVLDRKL